MTKYIADIGLEVHVELSTDSKMFCACAVVDPTESEPNSAVCPVCCGMPGTLPVINRGAVEKALRAAIALECEIARTSIFARKNYFYPDLPKGYQISQYEQPLAVNGKLLIRTGDGEKVIRIHRAHLEEDTGKLTHIEKGGETHSLVDLNRAGVPLLEIVSDPDMHTVEEVAAYSRELRLLLRTIDVSSGDMEKGTMRFEANLSMRPEGVQELGTRVEVKNLNSFKAMENAIKYQMEIQQETLNRGETVQQQTLGWDESAGKTYSQRSKENANDYRYFPEPDLPPLVVEQDWIDSIRAAMPELPGEKRARYTRDYDLHPDDVERLVENRPMAEYFEASLKSSLDLPPRTIVNWMLTDLAAWLNQAGRSFSDNPLKPKKFTELLVMVEDGTINQTTGKTVLAEMLESGKSAAKIVEASGMRQISDSDAVAEMVQNVVDSHPEEVRAYHSGKENIAHWLFGQVMKEAGGKANPQVVRKILQEKLNQKK